MSDTLGRLLEVFQDVFDDDDLAITRETSADSLDAWDSMIHVSLMLSVEKQFGIKFNTTELEALKNVGELVDLIDTKIVDH